MVNKSGVLILLIMLIVSAFVILMVKLAAYIRHFNGETRRIIMKMQRAADEKEYCYWHKMLRCHYLCLIPFVNERNVSGAYSFFFHQPKRAEKETRIDGVFHILAPSLAAFCLCAVCLCGASWAWFTASTSTGTTAIQSSSYKLKLLYQVGEDATAPELAETGNTYTLTSDTTVITLKAIGTAGATGYCSIKIGDETYYTEQISVNGTSEFTFTVNAAAGTQIILTPKWGSCAVRDNANLIRKDREIPATGSQQSNTQTPDNTVTTEPSTEPTVPTTPTAPTTPSSTPKESTTTTPEPSATAPAATQPEPTDTEPTPAPEETTADPQEAGAGEENGSPVA